MTIPAALLAPTAFTTAAEVEAVVSTLGVDLRTQELPNEVIMAYAVNFGTNKVAMKLKAQAAVSYLAASPWVRLAATVGAAYFLCAHGGEPVPGSIEALWAEIKEDLEEIHKGESSVPDLVLPGDYGTGPSAVNIRVDLQRGRIVRRVPQSSTDTPADYNVPNDWPSMFRRYGYWG